MNQHHPARPHPERAARALLTHLTRPADRLLPALLAVMEPGQALAAIRAGRVPAVAAAGADLLALGSAVRRWQDQLAALPPDGGLAAAGRAGIRLICPDDPQWPVGLDDLDDTRPPALWARGIADLAACSQHAVAIVGSRAATGYGTHVASDIAVGLAEAGQVIVSGAAYGIDGAAHRGALAATCGVTVAVLACGVDRPYPPGHAGLLQQIAAHGLVVSEAPPGRLTGRDAFLARNRIIAALTSSVVVVEAGLRSGTMSTVRHADALGRPVMAVPGPVTSAASKGCHHLIAERGAELVTSASDILAHLRL
jgi:DNA processing protein